MYDNEFVERNPANLAGAIAAVRSAVERVLSRGAPRRKAGADHRAHVADRPRSNYMTVWRVNDFSAFQIWNSKFRKADIRRKRGEFEEASAIVDAGRYANLGDEVL